MVEINLEYQGDLRVQAIHGPSQKVLFTDAPVDNHGKGESFSPTDLVATATAACMTTIMGIWAKQHQIDLQNSKVKVIKHMIADPKRRISKLEIQLDMCPGVDHQYQAALERVARECPVVLSLHPDIQLDIRFVW